MSNIDNNQYTIYARDIIKKSIIESSGLYSEIDDNTKDVILSIVDSEENNEKVKNGQYPCIVGRIESNKSNPGNVRFEHVLTSMLDPKKYCFSYKTRKTIMLSDGFNHIPIMRTFNTRHELTFYNHSYKYSIRHYANLTDSGDKEIIGVEEYDMGEIDLRPYLAHSEKLIDEEHNITKEKEKIYGKIFDKSDVFKSANSNKKGYENYYYDRTRNRSYKETFAGNIMTFEYGGDINFGPKISIKADLYNYTIEGTFKYENGVSYNITTFDDIDVFINYFKKAREEYVEKLIDRMNKLKILGFEFKQDDKVKAPYEKKHTDNQ